MTVHEAARHARTSAYESSGTDELPAPRPLLARWVPGLRPGDAILPPSESATTRRLVNSARHSIPDDIARDDVVYLATNREVAKGMRRTTRTETLYEVQPDAEIEPDPDCRVDGLSWRCARATVLRVVDPVVLLRERPMHWLNVVARGGVK